MLILLVYPNILHVRTGLDPTPAHVPDVFLYLSVFFTLGFAGLARTNKSSTSFLVLLFIWVIFVTIIPKVSG